MCVFFLFFGVFFPSRPQTEMQALLGLCGTTSLMSQTSKTQLHTHSLTHSQSVHTHKNTHTNTLIFHLFGPLLTIVLHCFWHTASPETAELQQCLALISTSALFRPQTPRKTNTHIIHSLIIASVLKDHHYCGFL